MESQQQNYFKLAVVCLNFEKYNSDIRVIKRLIKKEGSINRRIPDYSFLDKSKPALLGSTPLHLAILKNEYQIFQFLIENGAAFTIKNRQGSTVLHETVADSIFCQEEEKRDCAHSILSSHVNRNVIENPINNDGLSHFHIACLMNHAKSVEFFLANGVDVNHTVNKDSRIFAGYTGLHLAIEFLNNKIISILLKHGADVNKKNARGLTPLSQILSNRITEIPRNYTTIVQNDQKALLRLLKGTNESNLMSADDMGLSRFHALCTINFKSDFIEYVTDVNRPVSMQSPYFPGYTALHFAAHFEVATVPLLLAKGADMTNKNAEGLTPFDIHAKIHNLEGVYKLLRLRPEWYGILLSDNRTKLGDLIGAMREPTVLENFLQKIDADIFIRETSPFWPGYTSLHLAITFFERDLDTIQVCLNRVPDLTAHSLRYDTPIHQAFREQKFEIVKLIMQRYNDKSLRNIADKENLTFMHIACAVGDTNFLKALLEKADPNIRYKGNVISKIRSGFTPLHVAVAGCIDNVCNEAIIKVLLENGADPFQADTQGFTPVHWLIEQRNVSELFFSSLTTLKNCTVEKYAFNHLHVAVICNNLDAVKKLIEEDAAADINTIIDINDLDLYDDDLIASHTFHIHKFNGFSLLYIAMEEHPSSDLIDYLISHTEKKIMQKADLFTKKPNGMTPLFEVFNHKHEQHLDLFFSTLLNDQNLQKRVTEDTGLTMLHLACHMLKVDVVADLLSKQTDVNAQSHFDSPMWPGCTALHVLMTKSINIMYTTDKLLQGNVEAIFRMIVQNGADITLMDKDGNTPIHLAFQYLKTSPMYYRWQILLEDIPIDFSINPVNAEGLSHLHIACCKGDLNAARNLLRHGANVNQMVNPFSTNRYACFTPLHFVLCDTAFDMPATKIKLRWLNLLLDEYKADIHVEDNFGRNPLHYAMRSDYPFRIFLVDKLIRAGADINRENVFGQTPLETLLADDISIGELRYFLKKGSRNILNSTKFMEYVKDIVIKHDRNARWPTPILNELLEAPNFKVRDGMGRTIYHHMVSADLPISIFTDEYADLFRWLEKAGCDIDDKDNSGQTALHLAVEQVDHHAILCLLKAGADINITNERGESAFYSAVHHWNADEYIIEILAKHVYTLGFLGLDVSPSNTNLKNILASTRSEMVRRHIEEIREEVQEAKTVRLAPEPLRVYHFLSESGLRRYRFMNEVERKALIDSIEHIIYETDEYNFKNLTYIFKLQLRKAIVKGELLDLARISLKMQTLLPDVVVDLILDFLSAIDFKNVTASAIECDG